MVGLAPTPDGRGYWLVGSDGRVTTHGDAPVLDVAAGTRPPAPVVGIAAAPRGDGYWLASGDGQVTAAGDARGVGAAGRPSPGDVAAIAAAPPGRGFWLASPAGRVTAVGGAVTYPAVGGHGAPVGRVVSMAATPDGRGYWLVTAGGTVLAFGDAPFEGSVTSPLQPPAMPAALSAAQPAAVAVVPLRAGPRTARSGPARVLVVGDSLAFQTGFYSTDLSPPYTVVNGAVLGCGVSGDAPIDPWSGGGPVDPPSACAAWADQYRWAVEGWHPDVVFLLTGYWECQPRLVRGTFVDLGDDPGLRRRGPVGPGPGPRRPPRRRRPGGRRQLPLLRRRHTAVRRGRLQRPGGLRGAWAAVGVGARRQRVCWAPRAATRPSWTGPRPARPTGSTSRRGRAGAHRSPVGPGPVPPDPRGSAAAGDAGGPPFGDLAQRMTRRTPSPVASSAGTRSMKVGTGTASSSSTPSPGRGSETTVAYSPSADLVTIRARLRLPMPSAATHLVADLVGHEVGDDREERPPRCGRTTGPSSAAARRSWPSRRWTRRRRA